MPCFKGLAVSVHTPNGPISEYSVQKQHRQGRISTYIPVPPAKVPPDSTTGIPEQSGFSVSITLLVPGQNVPYSQGKATPEDPYPRGVTVGGLPGATSIRGNYGPVIPPYVPRTTSPNETLAAYIYFDGRAKEEVATLLRRGEETWVNSRWVSVQGGGLAEREFLFREVGLERWLNGLDLMGKDKAAKIEKRHQRLERKRRVKRELRDSDDEEERKPRMTSDGVLRYGNDKASPTENVVEDHDLLLSDNSSDDEPPQPEAAGQIKVALFRVLASGEIKRGEYEPQFDAQDDDGEQAAAGNDEDIDHTTTFAKPKSLDPKTISTQTVTGIDNPDSPYAVFTFFYRGEKQLQKMGILPSEETPKAPSSTKRKSTDFSKLGPLNKFGTVGFSSYRENATPRKKGSKAEDDDAMDSDREDDDEPQAIRDTDDFDASQGNGNLLSPEEVQRQGELAEGVQRIKLKRAHSADPVQDARKSPHITHTDSNANDTPTSGNSTAVNAGTPPEQPSKLPPLDFGLASPFKRQRPSMEGLDSFVIPPVDLDSSASAAPPASDLTLSAETVPSASDATLSAAPSTASTLGTAPSQPEVAITNVDDIDEEL